jgi:transposase-like protein
MDMQIPTRRRFSDKFKATVALEALRGDKILQEIAAKHRIHLLPAAHACMPERQRGQPPGNGKRLTA